MSYEYLASCYSHASPSIRELRYNLALGATQKLLEAGRTIYSPIVHWHPVAEFGGLPTDFEFWKHLNFEMLTLASRLLVLRSDGWKMSRGVKAEIAFAQQHNIPVEFL